MINLIKTHLSDVSLTKPIGKYLSDKSYGFDTFYFVSKFILYNATNLTFNKLALKEKAVKYIEDLFRLRPESSVQSKYNYYNETINVLTFANVLSTENGKDYRISQEKILKYISKCPENAYIFLYILVYMTLKNDGMWNLFLSYANSSNCSEQESIAWKMHDIFCEKSVSVRKPSQWSRQLVKYSLLVLGYINGLNTITRELNVEDEKLSIRDVALNVEGTRSDATRPKENGYLNTFNADYVKYYLGNILVNPKSIEISKISITDNIAGNLAEIKLVMLDETIDESFESDDEKSQYLDTVVKTRNPVVQSHFRKGLFDNNEHICPICGYSFERFLIASHIRPYAKCEDTYDAVNHFNGLLLCPNHDKLFEDAKHMTIEFDSGQIILSKEAAASPDYGMLAGKSIPKVYIQNERRHYLKWHNDRFKEHNK